MALVDYASSDEESDYEQEVDEKKEVVQNEENLTFKTVKSTNINNSVNNDNYGELFSSLPKPRKNFSFLEDDNKLSKLLLNKNSLPLGKKESVKICIPSASEFDNDVEQPPSKKVKPSSKGAGLFSILPPPKNNAVIQNNFVPQAVVKNQFQKNVTGTETCSKGGNNTLVKNMGADEEDDSDPLVGNSFFGSGLVEQKYSSELEYKNNESTLFKEISNNVVGPGSSFINQLNISEQNSNLSLTVNVDEDNQSYTNEHSSTTEILCADDNPLDLDEKALQILCGNKKKRQQMPMNIIDLSSEEVLPDSKEWLLKQFTEGKRGRSHSHKKNQGPSSQSRRKHQITYLAYQAKEQELELQNQWANNRMSRKQTQSKYGF